MKLRTVSLPLLACVAILSSCAPATTADRTDDSTQIRAVNGRVLSPEEVDRFVQAQVTDLGVTGLSLAIITDGSVSYHQVYGMANAETEEPITEASIFEAASLSKPVFAYFVMQLVDAGVLDLDVPLYTTLPFPELADDPRYHVVTARSVLSHTTGFPNWRWFDPAPEQLGIPRGTMYVKHNPGEFSYSGEAYHYLARVVAHLTDTSMSTLDDLMNERVAAPLGIRDFFWTWEDTLSERKVLGHREGQPAGRAWPRSFPDDDSTRIGVAGRLHTEARAYAQFLVGLMEGDGLTELSRDVMLSAQSRVPSDSDDYLENGIVAWGLGIAIEPTPFGTRYQHGGNNGAFQSGFAFHREQRVGYVFLTNSDRGEQLNRRLEAFLAEGEWSAPGSE